MRRTLLPLLVVALVTASFAQDDFRSFRDSFRSAFGLMGGPYQPTAEDLEVSAWIRASGNPNAIAITKTDKIGTNSRAKRYTEIVDALDLAPGIPIFPTSAAKKTGRIEMLAWVDALLEANAEPE